MSDKKSPFERPSSFAGPVSPEHPHFVEKLALALSDRELPNSLPIVRQVVKAVFDVQLPYEEVNKKAGRSPNQWLELFFLSSVGPLDSPTRIVGRNKSKKWPDAPLLKWLASPTVRDANVTGEVRPDHPSAMFDAIFRAATDLGLADPISRANAAAGEFVRYRTYLEAVARGTVAEEEEAILRTLTAIASELEPWGVHMNLCPIRLRLASHWDREPYPGESS
jgi:hypothetical protein